MSVPGGLWSAIGADARGREAVVAVSDMVGSVTRERYDRLVAEGRDLVETASRAQFTLGDKALEIAPLHSGGKYADPAFQVERCLAEYAQDIGISVKTLLSYRWVSSRWPADKRVGGVSHYIHKILAALDSETERFSILLTPPDPGVERIRAVELGCGQAAGRAGGGHPGYSGREGQRDPRPGQGRERGGPGRRGHPGAPGGDRGDQR